MARLWTSGGELGHIHAEGVTFVTSGASTLSFPTTVPRSGLRTFFFTPVSLATSYAHRTVTVTLPGTIFVRAWFRPQVGTQTATIFTIGSTTTNIITLALQSNTTVKATLVEIGSAMAFQPGYNDGAWNKLEVQLQINHTGTDFFEWWINGVSGGSHSGAITNTVTINRVNFGVVTAPTANLAIHFDDIAINDATGTDQNKMPDDGKVYNIPITSDFETVAWTQGSGTGTTGLFVGIDNIPPSGQATTGSGLNNTQIASVATGTNRYIGLSALPNTLLATTDVIRVIQPKAILGRAGASSTKTAEINLLLNPITAITTSASMATTTGAYPTNWIVTEGTVGYNPTVNRASGIQFRVRKTDTNSIALHCAGMYIIVEVHPLETVNRSFSTSAIITSTIARPISTSAHFTSTPIHEATNSVAILSEIQRTIASSAAILTVHEVSFASSAAVLNEKAKFAETSAILITTIIRNVTTSVPIKTVVTTHFAPSTAAILVEKSKFVPSSFAVLVYRTPVELPTDAEILVEVARVISTSANIETPEGSESFNLSVGTQAAIKVEKAPVSFATSANIITVKLVSFASTAALHGERTLNVPSSAALLVTRSATEIVTSAALKLTRVTSVAGTVAVTIFDFTLTAPTSVAASTTRVRNVVGSTSVLTTRVRDVSVESVILLVIVKEVSTSADILFADAISLPTSSTLTVKTALFTDDFNASVGIPPNVYNVDLAKWSPYDDIGGTARQTGQAAVLTLAQTDDFDDLDIGFLSTAEYDFSNSSVHIEVVRLDRAALQDEDEVTEAYFGVSYIDEADNDYDFSFSIFQGYLEALKRVNAVTVISRMPYNYVNHKWLRLREASGTVYYEVSTDGVTWVRPDGLSQAGTAWKAVTGTGPDLNYMEVFFGATNYDYTQPSTIIFDSLNTASTTRKARGVTTTRIVTVPGRIKQVPTSGYISVNDRQIIVEASSNVRVGTKIFIDTTGIIETTVVRNVLTDADITRGTILAVLTSAFIRVGPFIISPKDMVEVAQESIVFTFRMHPVSTTNVLHAHVRLMVANNPAFYFPDGSMENPLLDLQSYRVGDFEYDTSVANDGSGPWVTISENGVPPQYQGHLARITRSLVGGYKDWRVRMEAVDNG